MRLLTQTCDLVSFIKIGTFGHRGRRAQRKAGVKRHREDMCPGTPEAACIPSQPGIDAALVPSALWPAEISEKSVFGVLSP